MKTCPNCNSKLQNNEHLCIYCGTKLDGSTIKNATLNNEEKVSNSQNLETLNSYKDQFNTQEYKKVMVYGNRILIKAIYKKLTSRVGETLMIIEVDGVERKIVSDVSGDYVLVQGQENVWYQGPIVVAVIKKDKPVIIPKTSTPTVTNKTYNSVTPPKVQNSSVGETGLPTYHYWLLISSYLLSFTYIAPIIGIIASFIAYSDIEASSNKDKEGKLGLTIGAGVLHGFFIILGIYSNGGF
jgi:hypothetical protein